VSADTRKSPADLGIVGAAIAARARLREPIIPR
jgi:hypothetical protein